MGYLGEFGFEAHIRYRNFRGENVLHLTSKLCNPDKFRLLIPRFPEGNYAEDDMEEMPLLRVIRVSLYMSDMRYRPAAARSMRASSRHQLEYLGYSSSPRHGGGEIKIS